jgi:chloramphenicol-sensitive protein RarD
VPLSVIGLLQFLTPVMQFLVGVFLLHEPMPPERWIGFGLVWVALVMFTVDMLLSAHRSRTMRPVRSRGAVPADPAGGAQ